MVTTFEAWDLLDRDARLQTAVRIAAALGPEWSAVDKLRGSRELACLLHVPSSTEFVAVPGGTYVAGVRPDELELMQTIEFAEDSATEWLDEIATSAPPTEVTVKPLLVARAPLLAGRARALGTDSGWVVGDDKSDLAPIRFDDEQTEPIIDQLPWRLPTSVEWEWIARGGGVTPFINGTTFEEAEAACMALYEKAFDPERDDAGMNSLGVWGLPWGDWVADDDEPRDAIAGRGGAAMLYPWQGDEIIMQMAGMGDDGCGFDEHCLRFVLDLPAI